MAKLEHIELKEFIRQIISDVEEGVEVKKRYLGGTIDFDVSVAKTQRIGGNVKVYVLGGEGEVQKESIARIQFKVNPLYPSRESNNTVPSKNMGMGFKK